MRQVPAFTSYLLLGDGRMARHAALYLKFLELPFATWTRSDGSEALVRAARDASHVLVLVSDRSIEALLLEHPVLREKICVHFSGSVTTDLAVGAHPLMTFTERPFSLEEYRQVPFVLEKGRGDMSELLPGLPNPAYAIDAKSKALYHALCVMAGNFTVLLWEKVFSTFSTRFGLPKAVLIPYLERISENLATSKPGESVLTGPLVRRDQATIESNLHSLEGDPFANVYRAFVSAHERTHQQGGPRENRP